MNKHQEKLRDELRSAAASIDKLNPDFRCSATGVIDGYNAAMEQAKILEDALEFYRSRGDCGGCASCYGQGGCDTSRTDGGVRATKALAEYRGESSSFLMPEEIGEL